MSKRTNLQIWDGFCALLEIANVELAYYRGRWMKATSNEEYSVGYDRIWRRRAQILKSMERFVVRRVRQLN